MSYMQIYILQHLETLQICNYSSELAGSYRRQHSKPDNVSSVCDSKSLSVGTSHMGLGKCSAMRLVQIL